MEEVGGDDDEDNRWNADKKGDISNTVPKRFSKVDASQKWVWSGRSGMQVRMRAMFWPCSSALLGVHSLASGW